MADWYSRVVFFVRDVDAACDFYVGKLGFDGSWRHEEDGRVMVAQVSHAGFEIILNEGASRAGHGRVFVELLDEQIAPLRERVERAGAASEARSWGMPVTAIVDPDGNELYFAPPLA